MVCVRPRGPSLARRRRRGENNGGRRGDTFFFCSLVVFFSSPSSLWRRAVFARSLARPPKVGERSSHLLQRLSPRFLSPLSPNRPRPGLHDVRPFALGDPDLHLGRGQVGSLRVFCLGFFFPSSSSAASRHAFFFFLLRFYLPFASFLSNRCQSAVAISRPSLPRLLSFDAGASRSRRFLPDKAEKRARDELRGAQVRGGRMSDSGFSLVPTLSLGREKNRTERGDGDKNRGGGRERTLALLSPPSLFFYQKNSVLIFPPP